MQTDMGSTQDAYNFIALIGDAMVRSGASSASTTKTLLAIGNHAGLKNLNISVTMGQLIISDTRGDNKLPYTEIHEIAPGGLDLQWRSVTEEVIKGYLVGDISLQQGIETMESDAELSHQHSLLWSVIGFGILGIGFSQLIGAGWITTVGTLISSICSSLIYHWTRNVRAPGIFRFALVGFVVVFTSTIICSFSSSDDVAICVVSAISAYLAGVAAYAAVQDSIMGWYLSATGRLLDAVICTSGLVTGVAIGVGIAQRYAPESLHFLEVLKTDDSGRMLDPLIGAALVTCGFAISCGGRGLRLLLLTALGVSGIFIYLVCDQWSFTPYESTSIAAIIVGGLSVLFAKKLQLTSNAIMIVTFLPLFPGMMIYQGMLQTIFEQDGSMVTLGQALISTYCLSVGGSAGQYIVSEIMWGIRRAQFKREFPGEKFSKTMVNENNAQDIILPVFSRPFSKHE